MSNSTDNLSGNFVKRKTALIEVPDSFFKRKYFPCEPEEIKAFLKDMEFFVDDTLTCYDIENEVDIQKTIDNHTGDCRLWLKDDGGYIDFFPKYVAMRVDFNSYYFDIFDWMEKNTPSLHKKHINN